MMDFMRLWRHPNGYWYAELERNKRRSLGTRDKAEAQKIYRRLKSDFLLSKIAFLDSKRTTAKTLEDFTAEYLEWIQQRLEYNTYSQARSAFKALMIHVPPGTNLTQITRHQIDIMQTDMTKTAKASTINTRFRNYRTAFKKAVEWEYLPHNPFAGVTALEEQERYPRYLTLDEIATMLEAETHPRYRALWQLCLLSGLRRKEAVTLTWADIDLDGRRIFVRRTKNRKPRIARISDSIMEVLLSLTPGVGRLFPWGLRQATRRFKHICQQCGIDATLHNLRHTYGSYAAMAGIELFTIKNLLGHRDIKSTQIYAHLSPEYMAEAQTKLANALNLRTMFKKC